MSIERIGILGGAFDPFHAGHLHLAQGAMDLARLDRLIVLPAGDQSYRPMAASGEDRWKMVVSACSRDSRLVPSRLEIDAPPPVYTADTVLALRQDYPKAQFVFLMGADAFMKLHHWPRLEKILSFCSFQIWSREDLVSSETLNRERGRLSVRGVISDVLSLSHMPVSSTEIRDLLACGKPTPDLPIPLREFCEVKGLYGLPCREERAGEWLDGLFAALNPRRFSHSLAVAACARRLALRHGLDAGKAEQAGLLHDCAKCLPLPEMQRIALEHDLTRDEAMLSSGSLLHSLVGARVAEEQYGMKDPEVLEAIAYHNTGYAGMSPLAICVCLADSIEPTRDSYPLLEEIRALADESLEKALLLSLERTADYVRSQDKFLHPRTQETIAWLKTIV